MSKFKEAFLKKLGGDDKNADKLIREHEKQHKKLEEQLEKERIAQLRKTLADLERRR